MTAPLKLRAADGEDLCVIAAVLQDARAPINEMVFEPQQRRFMAAFTRVRHERVAAVGDGVGEAADKADEVPTCMSVLRLDAVKAVRWRGLEPRRPDVEHVVLTLLEEAPGHVLLLFHGGEAIRFDVERIDAHLEDVVLPLAEAANDPVGGPETNVEGGWAADCKGERR